MRPLKLSDHTRDIVAERDGQVSNINNRYISKLAKLAGAPHAKGAGVKLHTPLETRVKKGQPLFTIYAETRNELEYALSYHAQEPKIIELKAEK